MDMDMRSAELRQQRAYMDNLFLETIKTLPLPDDIEEYWTDITVASGWTSKCKVTRPKEKGDYPLVVLFFGGGMKVGSPDMMTRPARELASEMKAVVVAPTYKLVPEDTWPAPMLSAWEVLVHISQDAKEEFGASLDAGFVVGGVSSGAFMAVVAAGIHLLGHGAELNVERLAKPITGLFLNTVLIATPEIVPEEYKPIWTAWEENRENSFFTTAMLEGVLESLKANVQSPWFSIIHVLKDIEKASPDHPRFFIQQCQYDPLRDDGVILEKMLTSRGFEARYDLMSDDVHTAWCATPVPSKSKDPTIEESTMSGFRWLLDKRA